MHKVCVRFSVFLLASVILSSALPVRASEIEDDEAVAQREKEARDKLNAAKKAKPADESKDAAGKNPFSIGGDAGGPAPLPPPALRKVAPPPPPEDAVCPVCKGMNIVPNSPYRPYVKFQGQPAPAPDFAPPWKYCDKCQKGQDIKQISDEMKDRQQRAFDKHKQYEDYAGKPLAQFVTPFISVHSQLSPAINKSVAAALEKCAGILQNNSHTMVLMACRPDADDVVMLADAGTYGTYVDKSMANAPASDRELTKHTSGVHGPHFHVFKTSPGVPPESMAVFGAASMLMISATNQKAKPWLYEGFSAYCENATLGTNVVHTISYEANEVKLGKNWNDDMKKCVKEGKLKPWVEIFGIDLSHMKPFEYLTCYSAVSFLIKSDPAKFDKFVLLIKSGEDSTPAIEKAYGRKITELQTIWLQWVQLQK